MGRFNKSLIANIILEWQDRYIYYSFVKKAIGKNHQSSSKNSKEVLLNLVKNQIYQAFEHLKNEKTVFSLEFNQKISTESVPVTQNIAKSLEKLISFSLWNLKILNKALTRIDNVYPGSKHEFLTENFQLLGDFQSLSQFCEWEKKINEKVELWKPAMEGLTQPLLSKTQTRELIFLNELELHIKDQLNALKETELFPKKPEYPHFFTLLLMVISSFIQQTNFYILALAAKDYSSHLGVSQTFAGILSFATWSSIILCSFIYNYWTFFQYKLPTIFCGLFMVIGNFTYYLAFYYTDLNIAVFGRVLIGIGGARIINRKYINFYVDKSVVSNWNYFYLAGSIVGRGVGPILASSLYFIDYPTDYINGLTAPALLMSLFWALYTVLVILYFQEPEPLKTVEQIPKVKQYPYTNSRFFSIILITFASMIPKIAHEAHVTSIPIVASGAFDWSIDFIGVFIASISLAVAPVYIFMGFTRDIFEDRQFTRFALILTMIGSGLLICFDDMIEIQYILGTFILYLGVNMDDGIAGSLLTKFVPDSGAHDFINTGLLITVVGSLARGIGALTVPVSGWIEDDKEIEPDEIENFVFVPLTLLCIMGLCLVIGLYSLMREEKKVKIRV
jgi:MFS family permease